MKEPPTATQESLLEFDPADCIPAEDDRPAERPGIDRLIDSLRANGQLVPGLVCPHPDLPGKFLLLDGVGRWHACGRLGFKFKALPLPGVLSPAERIKRRLQCNVIRHNMTSVEIADDAVQYMELTGATQEEAAKELNLSPASLSRALTTSRRIPAELKAKAERVKPSIAWAIAALPTTDAMEQALDFATTAGPDGKLPTRETVARCLVKYKARKERGPKAKKLLKCKVEGRKLELGLVEGDTGESLIKFFNSLVARLGKHKDVPADGLGFLFQG